MDRLETKMESLGYSTEEIERAKELLVAASENFCQSFGEISDALVELELFTIACKSLKQTLEDFAERIREWVEKNKRDKETRKFYVPYNPPNEKAWYNQYQRNMIRDKRSDMKHFTINRRE